MWWSHSFEIILYCWQCLWWHSMVTSTVKHLGWVSSCLSCRFCGGLIKDIKRKAPFFASDFYDALNIQALSAILFIYLATVTNAITFGGLLGDATENMQVGKSFQNQQIQHLPFAVQLEECLGTGKAAILGTIMEVFSVFTAFSAAVAVLWQIVLWFFLKWSVKAGPRDREGLCSFCREKFLWSALSCTILAQISLLSLNPLPASYNTWALASLIRKSQTN